ncbi:N-formylglutamate amidohydrolase [Sphingomonas sp. Leaf357]|uniref:N-formylglutamate amidohydrolase n=1 Tax=Sphingomonas sp. Leaf357 TaxID=1736350 RepID=UPI0006FB5A04|nr:N-formylglutamate amidohydrolase [Sphingomonas sp. Leaf357]KQS04113.1 N-formylglutamate amidohydrolase [Sphingomonas sp. Leaf357]
MHPPASHPPASFDIYGASEPASPVILSVPHGGRDYPLALRAALRVPVEALRPLEDRHIDTLALAAIGGETMLVQRRARAWIDLNRAENERDPHIDGGADRRALGLQSAKVRGGLGLIPRRIASAGEIWRRKLDGEEVMARIAGDHRPYHAALGAALTAARGRFGVAVLLDVHSMPSLASGAQIVLGDRFGQSAGGRFVHRLEAEARGAGLSSAINTPYAGGHILDRHGAPGKGVHAVQLEFDRALYLDAARDAPGPGLDAVAKLLRRMIDALADEALALPATLAAE